MLVSEWAIATTCHKFFQVPITGTYQRIQTSLVWEKGEEADLGSEYGHCTLCYSPLLFWRHLYTSPVITLCIGSAGPGPLVQQVFAC